MSTSRAVASERVPSEHEMVRSISVPNASFRAGSWWMRPALISIVLFYLGSVLVGPIVALGAEVATLGIRQAALALRTPEALFALKMSMILLVVSVVVNATVGTIGAIVLTRHRFWGRGFVSALFDLPLAVSPVVIGLAFVLLFGQEGVSGTALQELGIKVVFSVPGLVIATLFVTLPYTVREVTYVLEEIGTSEEEAATTLGATPMQTFLKVTLPNIRVALGYGVLMTIARTLGEFGAVLVLGGSISGQTQTATTFIHDAFEERHLAGAYGMSVLLGLTSILLLLALELVKRRKQLAHPRQAAP